MEESWIVPDCISKIQSGIFTQSLHKIYLSAVTDFT